MTLIPNPRDNLLINCAFLSNVDFKNSNLERVYLFDQQIIYLNEYFHEYCYFPVSSAISCVIENSKREWVETEVIRNDGVLGLPSFLNSQCANMHAVVQCAGFAYRMKFYELENLVYSSNNFLKILIRFQQLRMLKIAQMSVCTRCHSLEQQLCRILLTLADYQNSHFINITQQKLADKLNVRRESITIQMRNLHQSGILQFVRGKLVILSREALLNKVCECYGIIKNETAKLQKLYIPEQDSQSPLTYLNDNNSELLA